MAEDDFFVAKIVETWSLSVTVVLKLFHNVNYLRFQPPSMVSN